MLDRFRAAVHRLTAPPAAPAGPDPADVAKAMAKADTTPGLAKKFGSQQANLLGMMNPGQPGNWGGDHAAEAQHFTGWNYSALHQLAKQALQADIQCWRDQAVFDASQLPFLRHKGRLRKTKARRLAKGYGDETIEAELLPPSHRLCKILRRPNPDQTGGLFNYERVLQIGLTGCCFVWNVPNKLGQTVQRYVLPTSAMRAVEPEPGLPNGGWKVDPSAGAEADEDGFVTATFRRLYVRGYVIPAEQVRVSGFPHPTRKDDFQSPLAAGALWIDTADQVAETRYSQLKNGGVPSMWLTSPEGVDMDETEAKATKAAIRAEMAGPANHRKVLLGVQGLEAKNLAPNATEMDFSGGHTQTRDAVLALHHTPAVAIGADVPKTYGAAAASISFYKWATVDAILCFLSDDDTEFFAPQFGKGLSVWYEAKDLNDPGLELKGLQTDVAAGNVITVNDYRSKRGYDPFDDERGEEMAGAATLPPAGVDEFGKPLPPGGPLSEPKPEDDDEEADDNGPGPLGLRRPSFRLPGLNGNGKAASNGHANGHDNFADVRKKAPHEYLPAGVPRPDTIDEALGLIAEQWAAY